MEQELEQAEQNQEIVSVEEKKPMAFEDGVIKINLDELNKPSVEIEEPIVDKVIVEKEVEKEVESLNEPEPIQETVIEEITAEEIAEKAIDLKEDIAEAVEQQKEAGVQLPDNIQKVVDFMNDTGGSLEDYVKLNTDYSSLDEYQLLKEYYQSTKPHLDSEEIDFLMEDSFSYDEDMDEDREIKRKKLARKEELSKAKNHLEGLKTKYYDQIKSGSKLTPDQQKAVEFFNRYNKENGEATKLAESQVSTFKNKTESLFSNDFKGFDFNVGEKKFRFKVNNADQVKDTQSDINNFVKKFLNDKNEMSDAAGYHKSLFTAMNADAIANHFYEQGKADAMKASIEKAKNIDMSPRGVHEDVKASNGWTVKAINPGVTSKFGIKTRK